TFMSIIERDDLELKEIEIWDIVVQWGIGQDKELEKDIFKWKKKDFIMLKNTLEDIIPLIRFKEISSTDFYKKIKPYKEVFIKEIYKELFQCHITDNHQPRLMMLSVNQIYRSCI